MSEVDAAIAKAVATRIKAGGAFSREVLGAAYYEVLAQRKSKEKPEASELWIDAMFEAISKKPLESVSGDNSFDAIADAIYASIVML